MDTFFEPPRMRAELDEPVAPAWFGPPEDVIGVAAASPFLLARTDALALAVWGITAFPTGIAFSLAIILRSLDYEGFDPDLDTHTTFQRYWRDRRRDPNLPLPDDLLRFGVEFADGTKATNLGFNWDVPEGQEPPGPVLMQRGGGGGGRSYRQGWWLWPLPPGDGLSFVAEWPAQGIPLTRHEIEADPLRRAAEKAIPIWD